MADRRKTTIEVAILRLLAEKSEITLRDAAQASDLSESDEADRKAIRRVLNSLINRGILEPRGAARARAYVRVVHAPAAKPLPPEARQAVVFKNVALSREAETLLQYISLPVHARIPVAYNQNFLRSYEPNATFYLDETRRMELFNIGRAESVARPAGTYARTILNRLLIDLSWNSSRLEGNTYSLLETRRLIELGENVPGKDASEAQMILNHKSAIEYIVETAEEKEISAHKVRSVHALLSENLLGDPGACGRIRRIAVGVGGSTYIPLENTRIFWKGVSRSLSKN